MSDILQQILDNEKREEGINDGNRDLIIGNDFASQVQDDSGPDILQHILDKETELRDLKIKQNLQAVVNRDPDRVGEAMELAKELGLPQGFHLTSNEAIQLMKEKQQRDYFAKLNLAKNSPILYKKLTDPKFAALAYDNLENLEGLEKLFHDFAEIPENVAQGWEKGRLQHRRGWIGVQLQWGDPDQETLDELKEIDARLAEIEEDGTGPFEEGFAIFGQYSKTLPHAFAKGGAGAVVGGAAGAWMGPGSIFTAKGGFIVGFMTSLGIDSWAIESGNAYLTLTQDGI